MNECEKAKAIGAKAPRLTEDNRPAVGTQMFLVQEHFYYIKGRAGPLLEYCVCEATVIGFYTGGYTEVVLLGKNPDGYKRPYYYKLSDVGKTLFYTSAEGAILAQKMTDARGGKHE